jgi:hypothetical protein
MLTYTSQLNGVAERKNRTILNVARPRVASMAIFVRLLV